MPNSGVRMEKTKNEIKAMYEDALLEKDHDILIGEFVSTGKMLFLLHLYNPNCDILGSYFDVKSGDRSTHRILAPVEQKVSGLTGYIFNAISDFVFRNECVQRIVDDPDIDNIKYFIACKQAGYSLGEVIQLPHKLAQLVYLSRDQFEQNRSKPPKKKQKIPFRPAWVFYSRVKAKLGLIRKESTR